MIKYIDINNRGKINLYDIATPYLGTKMASPKFIYNDIKLFIDRHIPNKTLATNVYSWLIKFYEGISSNSHMDYDISLPNGIPDNKLKNYDENLIKNLMHNDNIDAINIDKSKDIPFDYEGVIGVPVSILRYLDNDGFIRTDKGKYKIVGSSKNCFTSTKTYLNPKAYRNGIEKKGCQHIQTNGCLQVNEPPKDKCYYKADNSLYLVAPFMRILIIKT